VFLALAQIQIAAALLAFTPEPASVRALEPWHDPSPHSVLHIRVTPGVQLEVLDWGGSGKPLIFLAGGGEAAHVYDGFAPRFAGRFHVLGITRRGVGTSTHPAAGYDTTTLVRDIVTVLDSLGIARASFAGHSFAGTELNALGVRYPKRVDRLVYLDSGFPSRGIFDSPEWKSGLLSSPQPPDPSYEDNSIFTWTLSAERLSGTGYPEAEVRTLYQFDADGRFVGSLSIDSVIERLGRGAESVDLHQIQAPVLALYAVPGSAEVTFPWWSTLDATARARGEKTFRALSGLHTRLREQFVDQVPRVRQVIIPGARHYLFLTHAGEATNAMLEFLLNS